MRPRLRNVTYAIKDPALLILTPIPGIEPKRALALLRHFGTISAIMDAEEPFLIKVADVSQLHAASIHSAHGPLRHLIPRKRGAMESTLSI